MSASHHRIGTDESEESASGVTHRSLVRGLRLLETFAAAGQPMSLAETVRRVGLHRSTAHHMMQTLVSVGYLRQDPATRCYELTPKLYRLSGRSWSPEQIGEIAQPFLAELSRLTGEGTSVAAWNSGLVTIVAKQESVGPVRVIQDVGALRPIHCTAVGKAIAAWLAPAELRAALARTRMERHTANTITTRAAFDAELRRIRAAGYAIDEREMHDDLRCIAMPVFSHTAQVTGSMCVVGPTHQFTREKLAAVRTPLAQLSRKLSERLGYLTDGTPTGASE